MPPILFFLQQVLQVELTVVVFEVFPVSVCEVQRKVLVVFPLQFFPLAGLSWACYPRLSQLLFVRSQTDSGVQVELVPSASLMRQVKERRVLEVVD